MKPILAILFFVMAPFSMAEDRKLLFVDEDDSQRELMNYFLLPHVEVKTVSTGEQALKELELAEFTGIIITYDLKKQSRNGVQLAKMIHSKYPRLSIILKSSRDHDDIPELKGLASEKIKEEFGIVRFYSEREPMCRKTILSVLK